MKNKKIACVSDFQKSFFIQNYNSSNIKTIGAVILTEPKILENKIINILMVGYYSKLKGVNFFSEIADLAKKKGLEYKFNWLGDGPHGDLYFSPNVSWLGYSSNPKITMQSIDLFFLSSIEDSIPLVVYEALELHKKCVAYKNNGVAQILQKIDGCSVFEEYTPIQALNSIHQSINTEFSHTDALNYVSDFSNGKNFQKKLELLINE
jgi:glycosyltransferase involved in cell wall biosynthesis